VAGYECTSNATIIHGPGSQGQILSSMYPVKMVTTSCEQWDIALQGQITLRSAVVVVLVVVLVVVVVVFVVVVAVIPYR